MEESKKGVDSERDGERKINLTKRTVIIKKTNIFSKTTSCTGILAKKLIGTAKVA